MINIYSHKLLHFIFHFVSVHTCMTVLSLSMDRQALGELEMLQMLYAVLN